MKYRDYLKAILALRRDNDIGCIVVYFGILWSIMCTFS